MAVFNRLFREAVGRINERFKSGQPDVVNSFREYMTRSFVMRVKGDATYSFTVGDDGLDYRLNPKSIPDDMYVELDLGRAKKLVHRHKLGLFDLPFIKHRNITLKDVEFAKKIFGA